jgi:HPt (histidine-containing phosphotransfer) domain-containing protein
MQADELARNTVVDLPDLLARVEYDRELLRELFLIFNREFPPLQTELKQAVEQGDLDRVRTIAHSLKGMLASLSCSTASSSAQRIERMASQPAPEGIPEELVRLDRDARLAQSALETVCKEVLP